MGKTETLPALANADPWLVHRGRHLDTTMLLGVGEASYLLRIHRGRVEAMVRGPFVMPRCTFSLRGSREVWETFWQPVPPPGSHDIMALIKSKSLTLEGDQYPFFSNLRYFKDLLSLPRPRAARPSDARAGVAVGPSFEPAVGRYLHLDIGGRPHRLYVEQAGEGIPLVCLHTAGADGRQYRGLMNDPGTLSRFRVIAFDMPWHGKSSPPVGWQTGEYKLTSRLYVDTIMAVIDALELEKPVVMGCSIGGRIVLHLALEHARRFRALIGLESAAHADPYYDLDWLHRSDVHGGEVSAAIISGLVAPTAPEPDRWETIWHYMQGGPGVFKGDLHFYTADGDVRGRVAEIDARACPLYMLTGVYDYSASPKDTEELVARIPGAEATAMEGLGHFPMSEDPPRFLSYLRPVLERIADA
ncbi:MAG: alpha/beta fold hydrolase [Hyphomicrobiaceae bacterium]